MRMSQLRQRYCIVGVGNTAFGKTPGQSQVALNVLAIRAVLHDAGLATSDLDGVLTKAPTSTFPMLRAPRIAEALRVHPKIVGTLDQAGGSNIGLIQYAISCMELGQAEVIVIAYGDNPLTGTRASYARAWRRWRRRRPLRRAVKLRHGRAPAHVRVRHDQGRAWARDDDASLPRELESQRGIQVTDQAS